MSKDYKKIYEERADFFLEEAEKYIQCFEELKTLEYQIDSSLSSLGYSSYSELGKNELERKSSLRSLLPNECARIDMLRVIYETRKNKLEILKFYIETLRPLI